MRFGVLGPLAVADESGPVEVRAAKQRLLLAVLLTRPDRPVSIDRLADALWADDPPPSIDKMVPWHVHKLRRTLGDDRVARVDDGYRILVGPGEFDVHEFERLYRAGSRADGPVPAVEALTEALALWRGPAFGDLADIPALRGTASRLDDLRLAALERRVEAELSLGRHRELIGELIALVEEHAWRDAFRCQLMLALYRAGRRADALEVYGDGRKRMVEDLGIEPGDELRRLEQAILRDDPELSLPRRPGRDAVAEPVLPKPAELPAAVATFTGRSGEVERIREILGSASRAHPVITGTGGIGKSTLAIHVAHQVAPLFPDGQLYADLHGATPDVGPVDPAGVLAHFLRSLGTQPPGPTADVAELSARFRSATANLRLLIVLDDAKDTAQVWPLLPSGAGCRVVITSRRPLTSLDDAAPHRLGALTEDEARQLLTRLLAVSPSSPDPASVDRIADLCGRVPLALSVAAARANRRPGHPVADLADQLAVEHRRLSILSTEDRDIRASFMASYRDLADPAVAGMFRLSGLHAGADLGLPAAAALADVPLDVAQERLETLVDAGLMESHAPQRFRSHDLLRLFARELATEVESEDERAAAELRVLRCYLAIAREALDRYSDVARTGAAARVAEQFKVEMGKRASLSPPSPRPPIRLESKTEALAWVEAEFDNLLAVGRRARDTGGAAASLAARLPAVLQPMVTRHDRFGRLLDCQRFAAGIALSEDDGALLFFSHYDIGNALLHLGDIESAAGHVARALDAARARRDPEWEALALLRQADVLRRTDRVEESVACLRNCLKVTREAGDVAGESGAWIGLGVALDGLGRTSEAVDALRVAVSVSREGGHQYHQAEALAELGMLHVRSGSPGEAVELMDRALSLVGEIGLSSGREHAMYLWSKGQALAAGDRVAEARSARKAAVDILIGLRAITTDEARDWLDRPETDPPAKLRL